MRGVFPERADPDGIAGGLGREESDSLPLFFNQVFDQHHADEGLPEADTIAEQSTAEAAGDLQQVVEAVLLIFVQLRIDSRVLLEPLLLRRLLAAMKFVQSLRVDVEGRVIFRVTFNGLENFR